jgi:uncharacterized protein (DUF1501 family)
MSLSRRGFLGLAGGATVGAAVAGSALWATARGDGSEGVSVPAAGEPRPARPGRVLVVVQLNGGNDGLNTLVPAGDGRYHDLRPTLGVPDADVVPLAGLDRFGLHPALAPLAPLWDAGRLAAVAGIGLPGQTRSHFAAIDAWASAAPGAPARTGWLGRWLDLTGADPDPLRAVVLGGGSGSVRAERTIATTVLDPASFAFASPRGVDPSAFRTALLDLGPDGDSAGPVADARRAVPAALSAVDLLASAREAPDGAAGSDGSDGTGEARSVTSLLATAARIIELDVGTEVIVVMGDDFDTHAGQAERHPRLLTDLAGGLSGFMTAMDAQGRADDVLVVTTSEFGRRAAENGSGTDHGNASVQFVVGSAAAPRTVVGDLALGDLVDGDLKAVVDTRSLYAAALDWLGGDGAVTDEVLGAPYDRSGLVA